MHRITLTCVLLLRTIGAASATESVTYATDAVKLGVEGAFITDGRVPHALLNEILAGGGGPGERRRRDGRDAVRLLQRRTS